MKRITVVFALLMLMIPFSVNAAWDITGTDGRCYNLDEMKSAAEAAGKTISFSNTLNINPDADEIEGVQYQSIADAVAYIGTLSTAPSATNRWGLLVTGTLGENIDLANMAYIHIIGTKNAVLTGTIENSNTDITSLAQGIGLIASYPWAIADVTINNLSLTGSSLTILYNCIITGGSASGSGGLVILNGLIKGGAFNSYITVIVKSAIGGGTFGKEDGGVILLMADSDIFGLEDVKLYQPYVSDTSFMSALTKPELNGGTYLRCFFNNLLGKVQINFADDANYYFYACDGFHSLGTLDMSEYTGVNLKIEEMSYKNVIIGEENKLNTYNCYNGGEVTTAGGEWDNDGISFYGVEGYFIKLVAPVSTSVPINAVAAAQTLTALSNPAGNADSVTIDGFTYNFVSSLGSNTDTSCDVMAGTDTAATMNNLKNAINSTGATSDYNCATAHGTVAASDGATSADKAVTAKTKGASGNGIGVSATSAFSLGGSTLTGGVDGTTGLAGQTFIDSSYLYYCTADNTAADANWRRVSLGSAY